MPRGARFSNRVQGADMEGWRESPQEHEGDVFILSVKIPKYFIRLLCDVWEQILTTRCAGIQQREPAYAPFTRFLAPVTVRTTHVEEG